MVPELLQSRALSDILRDKRFNCLCIGFGQARGGVLLLHKSSAANGRFDA